MTDLTELMRLAGESGAATEMATAAHDALLAEAVRLHEDERVWLTFAIGVARGMKVRGRAQPPTDWRPEIGQYLKALEPLSLGALRALGEAVG